MHMRGNASGSTLRLSLGYLLSEQLGIELRCVGTHNRIHFGKEGESKLSAWLAENAYVTWMVCPEPWLVEEELVATLSLPLNLDRSGRHPFHAVLSAIRHDMKQQARRDVDA